MKKLITIVGLILTITVSVSGQKIAFTYDNDGNMESRYVSQLRSSSSEQEKDATDDIVSVELGDQKITVYPNPTKGEICVEISPLNQKEKNFIRLFDVSGRLLKTVNVVSERTYMEISGIPGAYLINIQMGDNVSKWKIIKH